MLPGALRACACQRNPAPQGDDAFRAMKVIQLHNRYRVRGGEDASVEATIDLLRARGVEVIEFLRDSKEIGQGPVRKLGTFVESIYSNSARQRLAHVIQANRPDVAHIHNLYPLLSVSVLRECRRAHVPIVMTCHNFRLICPITILFSHGRTCERCCKGRAYWCVLQNCHANVFESGAYAAQNYVSRQLKAFRNNVTLCIAPTRFVVQKLREHGYGDLEFEVIPHAVSMPARVAERSPGGYVAYAGRISPEKGVDALLAAAARCPGLPVWIAGNDLAIPRLRAGAPPNVRFVGSLSKDQLQEFYGGARFAVVPSVCFETFGLAAAEAMSYGLPVIASRIGGLPEVVEDGRTGLLFEPGNDVELAAKLDSLWHDEARCREMGRAARQKVEREYGADVFFERLMGAYERAIRRGTPALQ